MDKYHYTAPYLLDPVHPITIALVGLGGTGSKVLTRLALLHNTLLELGHMGLHVVAYDPDEVSKSNVGRQMFSPSDLEENKATLSISRVNRYFGLFWQAVESKFEFSRKNIYNFNIIISCVDNIQGRLNIYKGLRKYREGFNKENNTYYWIDAGNGQDYGQIVMGTVGNHHSTTKGAVKKLKNVVEFFPDYKKQKDEDSGPSCSVAEALKKQDLFINDHMALHVVELLWDMFRKARIDYQGVFVNCKTKKTNPIKL